MRVALLVLASIGLAVVVAPHPGADAGHPSGAATAAPCFADPPLPAVLALHDDAITLGASSGGDYTITTRWTSTALDGAGLTAGDPITLTYSFVPDGTVVPSGLGEAQGPSQLFAWMNGLYGSPAVWQAILHDELARWGAESGVTYVHEPADDGAPLFTAPGIVGVRGDVRFAAKPLDGDGAVVAYNYFPSGGGDMVLDATDVWYANHARDSRLLRNTVVHELGHGLGLMHVCPLDKTKVMEPIVLTGDLGPRVDDRRGAHRHYGDAFEPDDVQADALDLGTLPDAVTSVTGRSLHEAGDVDWIRFTAPPGMAIDVTLVPKGGTYPFAASGSSGCAAPINLATSSISNLGFELRLTGGTVLATVNAAPAGQAETLSGYTLPSGGGVFYLRVFSGGTDAVQLYDLDVDMHPAAGPSLVVTLPQGPPATIVSERPHEVPVQIVAGSATPQLATARIVHRVDDGPVRVEALFPTAGGPVATLPPCRAWSRVRWHLEIDLVQGGTFRLPRQPDEVFETEAVPAAGAVQTVFADTFAAPGGFTVSNTAGLTDGAWQRGTPVGLGLRGDPPAGFDADDSCWLTANRPGDSDVDGGATSLLSPVIDLSGWADARLSFAAWFTDDFGSNKDTQELTVDLSADGGATWVRADAIDGSVYAWRTRSLRILAHVPLTAAFQVRFTASDIGLPSVLEAGVDAFLIEGVPAAPFGPWAAGLAGLDLGGPFDLLGIDGDAGGASRTVVRAQGQPFAFTMAAPPGATALPSFAVFGRLGPPSGAARLDLTARIGAATFTPCLLAPFDAAGFVLADNLFGGQTICPPVLPSAPAPWAFLVPGGLPFPVTVQLQGVIRDDDDYRLTNALLLTIP